MGEASEMSTMSSTADASSASTTDQDAGAGDKSSPKPFALLLLLFLFLTAAVIGVVVLFGKSESSTSEAVSGDDGSPDNGGRPVLITPPPGKRKTSMRYALLCTYGGYYNAAIPLPPDGACDFIFFDSLYCNGKNKLGGTYETALKNLFAVASTWNITDIGVSVSLTNVTTAKAQIASGSTAQDELWDMNVRHFGILDADTSKFTDPQHVDDMFEVLKGFKEYQMKKQRTQTVTAFTVLGITFLKPRTGPIYDKLEQHLQSDRIDALIARTHISDTDKNRANCHITGPAVYDSPFADYQAGMVEVLQYVASKWGNKLHLVVYVSVTLKSFWYKPKGGKFNFGEECEGHGDTFDSYLYICDKSSHQATLKEVPFPSMVMFAYNSQSGFAFTFDSAETIKNKYCKAREQYHAFRYGLALYDIEFEDYANLCPKMNRFGPFSRLVAGKRVLEHVSSKYPDTTPADCLTLNYTTG